MKFEEQKKTLAQPWSSVQFIVIPCSQNISQEAPQVCQLPFDLVSFQKHEWSWQASIQASGVRVKGHHILSL